MGETPDHKVNKPGGGVVDFTDIGTYVNLNPDEMSAYVDLEKGLLERDMEEIFGEDFSDHASSEMERLGKDFGNALQKYTMGQALTKKPGYRKPMFSGGPDTYTVTKVAATIVASYFAGPVGAFAVQAAFTAVDVYDGTISIQQAAVQLAVAAATSGAGAAAGAALQGASAATVSIGTTAATSAVGMASSGITYNPDGGVGWSNSKFRQGVKSGMVNMGMSMAMSYYNVNGALAATAKGFMNSGLQTDGGWTDWGFSMSRWEDHAVAGLAAGAATLATSRMAGKDEAGKGLNKTDYSGTFSANDYMNHMAYNGINAGIMTAWKMGYHGDSWDDAVAKTGLYSGMTYTIGDMGGFLMDRAIKAYQSRNAKEKPAEESQKPQSEKQEDPLEDVEMGLSGIFESLWGGLKNLGNRFSNLLFTDKGFNTDDEYDEKTNEMLQKYIELKEMTKVAANGDAALSGAKEAATMLKELGEDLINRGVDLVGMEAAQMAKQTGKVAGDYLDLQKKYNPVASFILGVDSAEYAKTGIPQTSIMKQIAESLIVNEDNSFSFEIHGVEVNVMALALNVSGKSSVEDMMGMMQEDTFEFLGEMIKSDQLNIGGIQLNTMWRPGENDSHNTGLSLDFGRIRSNDGRVIDYGSAAYNPANAAEGSYRSQVFDWLNKRDESYMIWDPYFRTTKNRYRGENNWVQYESDYGKELLDYRRNDSDYAQFMISKGVMSSGVRDKIFSDITHRHHLHLTLRRGND